MPSRQKLAYALLSALLSGALADSLLAQQSAPAQQPRSPVATSRDCNRNGVDDAVDIASGASADCDANAVPDECDAGARVLLAESFEAGLPTGWTSTGSWHVTDVCERPSSCDGDFFAYFGVEGVCDFHYSSLDGVLTTPSVTVPARGETRLLFCSAYEGEEMEPYDAADVRIGGVLVDHVSPFPQLDWETRSVDLSAWAGQTIEVEFRFDAMDSAFNFGIGWQVDNVRVLHYPERPAPHDCNRNGVPDACEADCNGNGIPDACDLAEGTSADCDLDGLLDDCEVAQALDPDCNLNGVPDACDLSISLHALLDELETRSATMTSFFPDGYAFSGGELGTCIASGGLNMFACGSRINTDALSTITYTDGAVVASGAFGPDSEYFTAKYDGLFVMAAVDVAIESFFVSGFNGAFGEGVVDSLELSTTVDGQLYTIWVKRVHGTDEPSVNQILVIPGDGTGVEHTYPDDTGFGMQTLTGLTGIDRIFYVLVSRHDGATGLPLRNVDAREIVRELLAGVPPAYSTDTDANGIPDECD